MTRPPSDRNQGRKPIKAGDPTVTVSLRLTEAQREKLAKLGGAAWVRSRIDKAKLKGLIDDGSYGRGCARGAYCA